MKYFFYTSDLSVNKNFAYILGFQPDLGTMVLDQNDLYIFFDSRYFDKKNDINSETVKKRLKNSDLNIKFILYDQNYFQNIKEIVGDDALMLEKSVTYSIFDKIQKQGFKIDFMDDYFREFRTVKQDDEIVNMKNAIQIMDKIFFDIEDLINSQRIIGMTEKQLRGFIISKIFEYGGEGESFETIVAFGKGSSIPHYQTSDVKIGNGVLLIDTGAKFSGYCSDFTRTYRIGERGTDYNEFKKIYDIVKFAYEKAQNLVKSGIACSELDSIARDFIKEHGYGDNFTHALGHGIGLDAHENFAIRPSSNSIIPEDSFITIEPGIYLSGKFGVRLEDTFRVTKTGCEKFAKNEI